MANELYIDRYIDESGNTYQIKDNKASANIETFKKDIETHQTEEIINSDVTQETQVKLKFYAGGVSEAKTATNPTRGQPMNMTGFARTEEIYIGNVRSLILNCAEVSTTHKVGETWILYCPVLYNFNHTDITGSPYWNGNNESGKKRIGGSGRNEIISQFLWRPKNGAKYVRILAMKYKKTNDSGDEGVLDNFTESEITNLSNQISAYFTSENCLFFNDRLLNNKLIDNVSHQGYPLGSLSTSGSANRMSGFWGAYLRGFETLLFNIQKTADNVLLTEHGSFEIKYRYDSNNKFIPIDREEGTLYTVPSSDWTFGTANYYSTWTDEKNNTRPSLKDLSDYYYKFPTFDDACWIAKMCGMEIFIANSIHNNSDTLNMIKGILRKYRLHDHISILMTSVSGDINNFATNVNTILTAIPHAKPYYCKLIDARKNTDEGETDEQTIARIRNDFMGSQSGAPTEGSIIKIINDCAAAHPETKIGTWIGPMAGLDEAFLKYFPKVLEDINEYLEDNVIVGICGGIRNPENYVQMAPYISAFHSDFVTSGNCLFGVRDALKTNYPYMSASTDNTIMR